MKRASASDWFGVHERFVRCTTSLDALYRRAMRIAEKRA
jgi:hypothetical protein